MKVALVTSRSVPEWEVDDGPLHTALLRRGHTLDMPAWDDPAVAWDRFDRVLIRTPWDYTARRQEFVAWAERVGAGGRLYNSSALVRWNTHKSYLRDLEVQGVPIVPTVWMTEAGDPSQICRDRGWRRGFVKPAVGATAEGTLRFEASDGAGVWAAHVASWVDRAELMVQPYLSSVERLGERSAIVFGGQISHAIEKIPVPGDYRVQDDFGARDGPRALDADERTLVLRVGHALGALGFAPLYVRVDWLIDDDGAPRVNEVEAVEPSLFFRHGGREAAHRLVDVLEAAEPTA